MVSPCWLVLLLMSSMNFTLIRESLGSTTVLEVRLPLGKAALVRRFRRLVKESLAYSVPKIWVSRWPSRLLAASMDIRSENCHSMTFIMVAMDSCPLTGAPSSRLYSLSTRLMTEPVLFWPYISVSILSTRETREPVCTAPYRKFSAISTFPATVFVEASSSAKAGTRLVRQSRAVNNKLMNFFFNPDTSVRVFFRNYWFYCIINQGTAKGRSS